MSTEPVVSCQLPVASKPVLQPGDVVLFARLTLRQAWRSEGLRGLATWLGHWVIALFSQYTEGLYDGYWELVHAGIVVNYAGLRLMEFTINGNGMKLEEVYSRVARYAGAVLVLPLSERYRAKWSDGAVAQWVDEHRQWRYRWGGLPFAILHSHLGWSFPGRYFCSEAVIALLVHIGIVPANLTCWRGWRLGLKPVKPQGYAPCEVARLPQLARAQGYVWKQWPVASYQLSVGRFKNLSMRRLERKVKAAAVEVKAGVSLLSDDEVLSIFEAVSGEHLRRLADIAKRLKEKLP